MAAGSHRTNGLAGGGGALAILALAGLVVAAAALDQRTRQPLRTRNRAPAIASPRIASGPSVAAPRADVVVISVDALRPDHLGLHGYQRPTSPFLDAWAKRSIVFERAYCPVPHTSFSLTALMTGVSLYPRGLEGRAAPPKTIAQVVRRYGVKTGGFFPPSIFTIDGERLAAFERDRFGFEYVKYEHLDAARRVDQAIAFLDEHRQRQVLAWLHLFEPHEPYDQQPVRRFGPLAVDRYDSEVAEVDRQVGRLLEHLRRTRPGAIVVLTADHGEEFGECGNYYHGNSLSEPQIRVPLVFEVPGLAHRRIAGAARIVDVPITLLGLIDIPAPASMEGNDLRRFMTGAADELPPAFAELDTSKAVVAGRHKLVCDVVRDRCEHLLIDGGVCEGRAEGGTQLQRDWLRDRIGEWLASRVPAWTAHDPRGHCRRQIARGRLLDTAVIPDLLDRCGSWPELRREAARVLAAMRSPRALNVLRGAATDPDPEVRRAALVGAALIGDPATLRRGMDLLRDPHLRSEERRALLLALARSGERDAANQLAEVLSGSGDVYAQVEMIETLGKLGGQAAVPSIRGRLGALRTRLVAIEALGRLRDAGSIPAIEEALLEDRFTSRRQAAARALAAIGEPRVRATLRRALRKEVEPAVRAEIEAASAILEQVARKRPVDPAGPGPSIAGREPEGSPHDRVD